MRIHSLLFPLIFALATGCYDKADDETSTDEVSEETTGDEERDDGDYEDDIDCEELERNVRTLREACADGEEEACEEL